MIQPLLPEGVTTTQIALVCLTALAAGLARGFSGFGSALIFVPVSSAIIGPQLSAAVLLIVDFFGGMPFVPPALRQADRRDVGVMAAGAAIGVPLGALVLRYMDPTLLRWGIVILVFSMLILLASGWRFHGKPRPPLAAAIGVSAGFFSGAAQAGGPPVVAYWLGGTIGHRVARANIMLYFAISSVLSMISYLWIGLLTENAFKLAVFVGPVYALGLFGGSKLFGRADEAFFRRICLGLIAVAAVLGLPIWR